MKLRESLQLDIVIRRYPGVFSLDVHGLSMLGVVGVPAASLIDIVVGPAVQGAVLIDAGRQRGRALVEGPNTRGTIVIDVVVDIKLLQAG